MGNCNNCFQNFNNADKYKKITDVNVNKLEIPRLKNINPIVGNLNNKNIKGTDNDLSLHLNNKNCSNKNNKKKPEDKNLEENIPNNKANELKNEFLKIKPFDKNYKSKKSINIVITGDKFVGKSSIVYQFINNNFESSYVQTMFKEQFMKFVNINGERIKLNISVTSGIDQYQEDYTNLFSQCDFFVVCYNVTSNDSFIKAKEIINKKLSPYIFLYNENLSNMFLLGNKTDLNNKQVNSESVKQLTELYKINFIETSAKNNENIKELFDKIIQSHMSNFEN